MLLFSDLIEGPPVVSVRGVNDWGLVVSTWASEGTNRQCGKQVLYPEPRWR